MDPSVCQSAGRRRQVKLGLPKSLKATRGEDGKDVARCCRRGQPEGVARPRGAATARGTLELDEGEGEPCVGRACRSRHRQRRWPTRAAAAEKPRLGDETEACA